MNTSWGGRRTTIGACYEYVAVILFAFDRNDPAVWSVVNDGVMGGRSSGFAGR